MNRVEVTVTWWLVWCCLVDATDVGLYVLNSILAQMWDVVVAGVASRPVPCPILLVRCGFRFSTLTVALGVLVYRRIRDAETWCWALANLG